MTALTGDMAPDVTVDDAVVAHAVDLLRKADDSKFARWADICDDLFVRDTKGNTLLHWAAALGQLRPLKLLVKSGLDLDAKNHVGATPLLCAAASCRNPGSTISYFLRTGACMEAKNHQGDDVFSLLERRDLGQLVDIFEMLKASMEGCPRLFSSSGYDASDELSFAKAADKIGTTASLAKQISTVRFKNDNNASSSSSVARAPRTGTPEGAASPSPSQGGLDGTYGGSSTWGLTIGDGAPSPVPFTPTQPSASIAFSVEQQLSDVEYAEAVARIALHSEYMDALLPIMTDLLQFTTWLYNNLALEVFTSDDDEEEEVEVGELDQASYGGSAMVDTRADPVAGVFGERHDMDGERVLLVQWRTRNGDASNEGEKTADREAPAPQPDPEALEWVPLKDVIDSPCVQRYMRRFDKTYSDSALQDDQNSSFGLDHTNSHGGALDEEERDELERMLGMIPPRELSPEIADTWRWSNQAGLSADRHKVSDHAMLRGAHSLYEMDVYGHTNHDDLPEMRRTIVRELPPQRYAPDDRNSVDGESVSSQSDNDNQGVPSYYQKIEGSEWEVCTAPTQQKRLQPSTATPLTDLSCERMAAGVQPSLEGNHPQHPNAPHSPRRAAPSPVAAPPHVQNTLSIGPPSADRASVGASADTKPIIWKSNRESPGPSASSSDAEISPSRNATSPSDAVMAAGSAAAHHPEHLAHTIEPLKGPLSTAPRRFVVAEVKRPGYPHPARDGEGSTPPSPRVVAAGPGMVADQNGGGHVVPSLVGRGDPQTNTKQRLTSAEQLDYQRFLYQSAMERLRARHGGFAALRQK